MSNDRIVRLDLKARTREEYGRHLRLHVRPFLGHRTLASIGPQDIRTWRAERLGSGVGRSTVAKTYRILHAIFATAVDDDLIRRNLCRIKSAGQDKTEERPTATLAQVFAIADAVQPRYRLMVLLAAFAQLRFGELVALRRRNVDRVADASRALYGGASVVSGRSFEAVVVTRVAPGAIVTRIRRDRISYPPPHLLGNRPSAASPFEA